MIDKVLLERAIVRARGLCAGRFRRGATLGR